MPDGAGKPRRPRGRPTVYTEELGNEICARLAEGESLWTICAEPHMPPQSTVKMWVLEPPKIARAHSFPDRYARAKAMGYEVLADQILTIGDAPIYHNGDPDNALVQHARLMSENRKWLLSKLLPKQFGDKVTQEITGEDGGALITRIELVPIAPRHRQIEHDEEAGGKPKTIDGKKNG
jgi:hypothetical protein